MTPPRIPAEAFSVDRNLDVPLYMQLQHQIVAGVLHGRLRPGDRLPATRSLARHLIVARITIGQAYSELAAIGCLEARDRSGHYIAPEAATGLAAPKDTVPRPRFDWSQRLDGRFSRSRRTDFNPDWRSFRFPFVYGQIAPEAVDHAAWRDCAVRALGRREFSSLTADLYGDDDPELVDYIIRHILPHRGIHADASEILLTLGGQNGLWLVAEILLNRGGQAAVEDPCYPGLREILSLSPAHVVPVPVDANGLDPARLPPGLSAVFTTASHHCPTNVTMPPERRRHLLDRALRDGFAVIEDDYAFELSFSGPRAPALKAIDDAGAVIHVGSFSKTVFPGLRLGYLVADPAFVVEARALRARSLRHPPGMLQRTLANFLALGHYEAQLGRMRRVHAERHRIMLAAIRACRLSPAFDSTSGSGFWIETPEGIDSPALAKALRTRDVLIEPGLPFCADPALGRRHFRLGHSAIPAERIPEGIARIAETLETMRTGLGGCLRQRS